MNIAHYLTFLRIVFIPFFPLIYLYPHWFKIEQFYVPYFLIFILLVCEITDIIDGILARKKNIVTDIGKIIDPMADTITHISVFFTFTQGVVSIPLILVFILLYRELVVSALRTVCALKGFALAARKSGKIKTITHGTVSFIIVVLMMLNSWGYLSLKKLQSFSFWLVFITAIYSLATAFDYFYSNRKYFKKLV